MLAVLLLVIAVYGATNYYIAARLFHWLGLTAGRGLFIAAFALLAALFPLTQFENKLPLRLSRALNLLGGWYAACYALLLFLVPAVDLLTWGRGGRTAALALLLGVAAWTAWGVWNAGQVRLKRYTVEADVAQPVRIALLSDLHLGWVLDCGLLARAVELVNGAEVDYVMLAGDTFDEGPAFVQDREEAGRLFAALRAKRGIFACLGNHDGAFRGQEDEAEALLTAWGVTVLRDRAVCDGLLTVAGRRDDAERGRIACGELLKDTVKENTFTVLLDHQPGFFAEEKAAGADLILCGHTHRGQIFPMGLITRAIYRPDYGMKREDGCTMIVTSGVGTWGPRVRTCSSGEVAVITLTPRA